MKTNVLKNIALDVFSKNGTASEADFAEAKKKIDDVNAAIALQKLSLEEQLKETSALYDEIERTRKVNEAKRIALLKTELAEKEAEAKRFEAKAERYRDKVDIDEAFEKRDAALRRVQEIRGIIGQTQPTEGLPVLPTVLMGVEHKPSFTEKILSHSGTIYAALIMLIGLAYFSYDQAQDIGRSITEINKLAEANGNPSQLLPPDISKMSLQKAWIGWLNVFTCFAVLLVLLAIVAPDKLFFLLPFTKQPVDKWKSFFSQSEEQKQWQSFAWFAVILLALVLSLQAGK